MPWRLQATKDVATCEKLRGAGKRASIRRCPNGETRPTVKRLSARAKRAHKATLLKRARKLSARAKRAHKATLLKRARKLSARAKRAHEATLLERARRLLNGGSLPAEFIGRVEQTR